VTTSVKEAAGMDKGLLHTCVGCKAFFLQNNSKTSHRRDLISSFSPTMRLAFTVALPM
jgi:hypothetical protein